MQTELVEIYSNTIMRHPLRRFPGMLIQGDSLYILSQNVAEALAYAEPESDQWYVLKELAEGLQGRVDHYVEVMREHNLELPFIRSSE